MPATPGAAQRVVEKGNHSLAQRWWRTLAEETTLTAAQASLDEFCIRVGDARTRSRGGVKLTVTELAAAEPLAPPPITPYPAVLTATRTVSAQALVAFRGNRYSVPPGMAGRSMVVTARLGDVNVSVATEAGVVVACHRRAPDGAGAVVRDGGHVRALEHAALAGFSDTRPCRTKTRRPVSVAARAEADALTETAAAPAPAVVDFAAYAAAVRPMSACSGPAAEPTEEETR